MSYVTEIVHTSGVFFLLLRLTHQKQELKLCSYSMTLLLQVDRELKLPGGKFNSATQVRL